MEVQLGGGDFCDVGGGVFSKLLKEVVVVLECGEVKGWLEFPGRWCSWAPGSLGGSLLDLLKLTPLSQVQVRRPSWGCIREFREDECGVHAHQLT